MRTPTLLGLRWTALFLAFAIESGEPAYAQVPAAVAGPPAAAGLLPALPDWFLSTGSWADDPQIYVREIGHGTPVVMLHGGWGAEHSGLVDAVRALETRHRFIFYDQRGSLRSPAPDGSISFDGHVEDLERLRVELGLDRLTIVAHSMGAVLAGAYATKYPARIQRLVLVSPAYLKNPIPEDEKALQHEGYLGSQAFLARPEVREELARFRLDRTDSPLSSREATSKDRIALASRMLYDVRNWTRMTGGRALFKRAVGPLTTKTYPAGGFDYVQEFGRRDYPVAILAGDHDFVDFGNPLLRKWTQQVPRVTLSLIPRTGHLPWLDQPDAFVDALRRLLDAPEPARPSGL